MQRSVMEELRRADPRAVSAALRGAAASDLPAMRALRSLRVPTLVLAWRGDPTHPLSTAKRLAELIPGAKLHVADSGEEMRVWIEKIRAFLGAEGARPGTPPGRRAGSTARRRGASQKARPAGKRQGGARGA